jgi:hypothetical protein
MDVQGAPFQILYPVLWTFVGLFLSPFADDFVRQLFGRAQPLPQSGITINIAVSPPTLAPRITAEARPKTTNRARTGYDDAVTIVLGVVAVLFLMGWIYLSFRQTILLVVAACSFIGIGILIPSVWYLERVAGKQVLGKQVARRYLYLSGVILLLAAVDVYLLLNPDFRGGAISDVVAEFDNGGLDAVISRYGIYGIFFVAYQFIAALLAVSVVLLTVPVVLYTTSQVKIAVSRRVSPLWMAVNKVSRMLPAGKRPNVILGVAGLFAVMSVGLAGGFVYNFVQDLASTPVLPTPNPVTTPG